MASWVWSFCQEAAKKLGRQRAPASGDGPALALINMVPESEIGLATAIMTLEKTIPVIKSTRSFSIMRAAS